jgi:hypothetical protein
MRVSAAALTFRYANNQFSASAGQSPAAYEKAMESASVIVAAGQTVVSDAIKTEHLLYGSCLVEFPVTLANGATVQFQGSNDPDTQAIGTGTPGEVGQPQNWANLGSAVNCGTTGPSQSVLELALCMYRWVRVIFTSGGTNTGATIGGRYCFKAPH